MMIKKNLIFSGCKEKSIMQRRATIRSRSAMDKTSPRDLKSKTCFSTALMKLRK